MQDPIKQFNDISNGLNDVLKDLKPKTDEMIKKLQGLNFTLSPKLIKNCEINKHKAKITLYTNGTIQIEFADKEYSEKFYNSIK